jgi:hypothetical protein
MVDPVFGHYEDEPEGVREQCRHDSHKPNHALIMPQSCGRNAGYRTKFFAVRSSMHKTA